MTWLHEVERGEERFAELETRNTRCRPQDHIFKPTRTGGTCVRCGETVDRSEF